jgi:hypothetical protein
MLAVSHEEVLARARDTKLILQGRWSIEVSPRREPIELPMWFVFDRVAPTVEVPSAGSPLCA